MTLFFAVAAAPCIPSETPLSFYTRSVSRVDKATAGTSRTLHLLDDCSSKRPDARETRSAIRPVKKKTNPDAFLLRTRLSYFRLTSLSRVSTRDSRQLLASTKAFNNVTNLPSFGISVIISTQKSLMAKFVSCRKFTY